MQIETVPNATTLKDTLGICYSNLWESQNILTEGYNGLVHKIVRAASLITNHFTSDFIL